MDVPVVARGMSLAGLFMNSNERRLIELHLQHEPRAPDSAA
ncbi:hypothetical protein SCE1572_02020 [Sorangium cellulosum So0157-2]|uniref:Uncharacterized protein n=1 Tax=Sorangium cellulosum So0157-2 TaxID=1254432 RepID=S4XLH1_SORCE|nr:hypothetical protein SCE1572_02020 [Sorangium cellulosum So0157-2]